MRCTNTEVVENRTLCLNCGHIDSAHPQAPQAVPTSAGSLIKQFQAAGKLASTNPSSSGSKAKATLVKAESETNTNLKKKKRKSDTYTEPPAKRKKAKQPEVEVIFFRHCCIQFI
jgi:hypothetical protein